MNNKGFIATSLIYSFFLIFITLFLTIIADYLQNKVLLNDIEDGIKDTINSTKTIEDFDVGDIVTFNFSASDLDEDFDINTSWVIGSVDFYNNLIVLYSANKASSVDSCITPIDCLSIEDMIADLSNGTNNSLTEQINILNSYEFSNPLNNEVEYNFKLEGIAKVISKNCVKAVDNSLNYDNCEAISDSNTKYRIRKVLDVENKKFIVKSSGTNNFTITEVR